MNLRTIVRLMGIRTLLAGVIPVVLASIYSLYKYNKVNWFDMCLLVIAMILVQSAAGMLNEYYNLKRSYSGAFKAKEQFMAEGEAKANHVLLLIGGYLGIDLVIGVYYAIKIHYNILLIGLVGVIIIFLFSGGKKPISHTPFGEFVAGSTMGFGIVTTVIYIHTGIFNVDTTIVALPMAIYIGTILLTDNIANHAEDKVLGKKTLAFHLGIHWSEVLWFASCHSLLTFMVVFVFVGYYPLTALVLVLIMFPYRSLYRFRRLAKDRLHKREMMRIIGHIGIRYNMAIIIGMIITLLLDTKAI